MRRLGPGAHRRRRGRGSRQRQQDAVAPTATAGSGPASARSGLATTGSGRSSGDAAPFAGSVVETTGPAAGRGGGAAATTGAVSKAGRFTQLQVPRREHGGEAVGELVSGEDAHPIEIRTESRTKHKMQSRAECRFIPFRRKFFLHAQIHLAHHGSGLRCNDERRIYSGGDVRLVRHGQDGLRCRS